MTAAADNRITIVDLFAGCGGLTQGFHEFRPSADAETAPFQTVGAVEWDLAAASTYAANFASEILPRDQIYAHDIGNLPPDAFRSGVDVILGGPPCQGFSGLGKRKVDDPRNKLWRRYMEVVKRLKPKVFIIENVDRFRRSQEFTELWEATEKPDGDLKDYRLEIPQVINSADYGVPQARRRTIVLATHRDLMSTDPEHGPLSYPRPTHRRPAPSEMPRELDSGLFDPWVPVSTIFKQTPREPSGISLPDRRCSPLGVELPGTFKTTELHLGRIPTEHSLERYAAIPPGGNRHDLPPHLSTESWMRHRTGSQDVMGRLFADRPSVTIRTEFYKPEKGRYLHPIANRPITHYEAALIQGFPPDFRWCGSKVQIARQIGNAVPVGLARALAGAVYHYLHRTGEITGPESSEAGTGDARHPAS